MRKADGEFASPGAWGVVWEDLVEFNHHNAALWDELAEMFLAWCRRGVDQRTPGGDRGRRRMPVFLNVQMTLSGTDDEDQLDASETGIDDR